jgi:hypothetical protein
VDQDLREECAIELCAFFIGEYFRIAMLGEIDSFFD